MTNYLALLREFHTAMGLPVSEAPAVLDIKQRALRMSLLSEEWREYLDEDCCGEPDLAKVAKELGDVLYIAFGTAVAYGLPMDQIFEEIHRSNMSKLGPDGKPQFREDGKVMKGPNYSPADVEAIVKEATK